MRHSIVWRTGIFISFLAGSWSFSNAAVAASQALGADAARVANASPVLVRQVEGVHEYRLSNGLQVLLIADASKPTVTVNVTYRVGSRMEGYGETGMAHLLEHLLFKSTKNIANVGVELSKRGMQFNGTTNADRTNYFETFPADPALLSWALKTEAERMTHANISRRDLDTEMTVVRNEMESGENNPTRILIQKTTAAAYQWHAYGKDTIGARSDVENVNIAQLQAFYRKYYQPDNASLIVAGAFNEAAVLKDIARYWASTPKPVREIAPTYTVEPVQDGEREVTLRRAGGQQALFAVYHTPSMASPDFPAFDIIATALADTPNGRLHKGLVEAGKATQVFAWAGRRADPGQLNIGVVLKKDDDLAAAQKIFLETVEGLQSQPITASELKRTQLQLGKEFEQTLADPRQLCLALSEAIAGGDWRLLFLLRDRIEAATLEQVNAVVQTWIKPSNRTLGRFIPDDKPERTPLAQRVDAQTALQKFQPRAAVDAGEVFNPSPANLDKRTELSTLPSGLKLALLPKKSRGGTVEVRIDLHFGNLENLRGQRAAAGEVAPMLMTGSRDKTRAQLSDAFDALKTDWNLRGAASGASVALTTQRETLIPALELLAEVLRQPGFNLGEFEQLRRQNLQAIDHERDDPGAQANLALQRALYPYPDDDVRYTPSFAEDLAAQQALTLAAVQRFYRSHWGADHATVGIVGDFDAVQVKAALTRLLGDWKSGADYARVPHPVSNVAGQRLSMTLPDKANAVAFGQLPLALGDQDPDYPALSLAVHVMGGGGFDSRLLTRLRQKEGLSYSVGATLAASAFEPSGAVQFFAIYAPQNRSRVEAAFADELTRLVRDGISAEELASAKQAMMAGRNTARANDGAVANGWATRLDQGRTFAWSAEQDRKLLALTVEQVNAALARWIVPARVNWSLAGDFQNAGSRQ